METSLISHCQKRLHAWSELVVFAHAVFMLPFMAASLVLAAQLTGFSWWKLLWIVIAHLSARHVAMLGNRLLDLPWDRLNPRTRERGLVSGAVSGREAWILFAVNLLVFLLCCFMLNWLCLALSPLALFIIVGYSYSKRFSALCHFWLGIGCALGPMGAWVGFTGNFDFIIWPLGFACALWVAGFDIIYACQDIDFDRQYNLKSIPARLGRARALVVARAIHLLAVLLFFSLYFIFPLKPLYLLGCLFMACGLFYQHFISHKHNLSPFAFTSINGIIALGYFIFLLLAVA